jgi:cytochrome b561
MDKHAESSQFNAFDHSTIHWTMALVFIVGVALSAIFQTGELVRDD